MKNKDWITSDGEAIKISDMTDAHLSNIIKQWGPSFSRATKIAAIQEFINTRHGDRNDHPTSESDSKKKKKKKKIKNKNNLTEVSSQYSDKGANEGWYRPGSMLGSMFSGPDY